MRVRDKIATLQVGDTVVVYMEYSTRDKAREYQVTKVGRQYLYAGSMRFSRETGGAEFGYQVFPGTLEEYNAWVEHKQRAQKMASELNRKIYMFTPEELDIIEQMLNK